MTTEVSEAGVRSDEGEPLWPAGPDRQYYGYVIIEWPAPRKNGVPGALAGWGCSILDAETGKPVTTVEKITTPAVSANARSFITCDLVMFADEDGKPILGPGEDGKLAIFESGGQVITGVFPFLVAEMRVRS